MSTLMIKEVGELFKLGKGLDSVDIDNIAEKSDCTDKSVDFSRATLKSIKSVTFKHCVFYRSQISDFTFKKCTFIECNFVATSFSDVEFHSCRIVNCLFQKPKFKNTYLDPRTISFDFNKWKVAASNINTWLFQQLESNFKGMHQDEFVKYAHISFRRYRRWQMKYEAAEKGCSESVSSTIAFVKDVIYDVTMRYGYGLVNIFVTTLIMVVIGTLALNQWWDSFRLTSNVGGLEDISLIQKLYFLIVTSTTLGYGDISPKSSMGMLFVMSVLLFSVIWTATITAIVVKRIVK